MSADPSSLQNLHDIVVPDEVSWWPLAPGWFLLMAILLIGFLILTFHWFKHRRINAYRRDALASLEQADSSEAIAKLLRRTALAFTSRETVAALDRDSWPDWLESRSPTPLTEEIRQSLTSGIYQSGETSDLGGLRAFAEDWIRNHRRPC